MSTILINFSALEHNLQRVRVLAPHSKILAMVKANAYGHGLVPIAKALSTADALGVASLSEALELRAANITTPIVVMSGALTQANMDLAMIHHLDMVIHRIEQLDFLKSLISLPRRIFVKINTGMNRVGCDPSEVAKIAKTLENIDVIWMTHFACSDDLNHPMTDHQASIFYQALEGVAGEKSLAASCAILTRPEFHADWVRPGMMLYGASPFPDKMAEAFDLQPVMTLQAPVIAVHHCEPGSPIGYGATYVCAQPTKIAVLGIGYGDGYPRHAKTGTPVLLQGQLCPVVGRVSMDMITVDISALPHISIGDIATLWGEGLPVEIIARWSNTIPYELVTHVSPRH